MGRNERRAAARLFGLALAVIAVAGVWACWWHAQTPTATPSSESTPTTDAPLPLLTGESEDDLPGFAPDEHRAALPTDARDPVGSPLPDDFDSLFAQLLTLALEAHSDPGVDLQQLSDLNERGRTILTRMFHRVEDPDLRALFKLTGLPSEDTTLRGRIRRQLCVGILRRGLDRKLAVFETGGDRDSLDRLVQTILDSIPQDELVAQDLAKLLTGTEYLGIAHEQTVLDLVAQSAEDRFLVPWVTGILETLWRNMQADGARTSEELVHLALMFRADANRAKRLVALRHLLTAAGGRYRELVLHEVVSTRDAELAEQLTMTAATELPPPKALSMLERLSMVTTRQLMPAFMSLGGRDPRILVDAYEQKLADGTRADFRAELVTGAGFRGGATGLEIARVAFGFDPEPDVRTRALFVLTAQASAKEGEKALVAALDDPIFRNNPSRLGDLVLALENLVGTGDPNVVDRVGRLLLKSGKLRPGDRKTLEGLIRKAVPRRAK